MAILLPYLYTGGVYKHGLLIELLEDLGGYIIQKVVTGTEVNLIMLIPEKDVADSKKAIRRTAWDHDGSSSYRCGDCSRFAYPCFTSSSAFSL